ncbi:hypothetical protein [Nonomuraea sp. NPDC023979]|uniref:ParB/RepB/Spo0J family partition protein n=1 Tax=Nonomuraea sp. NPDC023979 TaxID=3154796 RepID=UPI0033DC2884
MSVTSTDVHSDSASGGEPAVGSDTYLDLDVPEDYRLARIEVRHLGHSPYNVREDLHITQSFCASLKTELQVPLTVVPIPDNYQRGEGEEEHRWWVVKGNRRLEGARAIKLEKMLCLIDLTKNGDLTSMLVDQVVENDDEYRRGLTPFEQSRALFLAHRSGATRAEIRKKTGRTRQEIADALAAGKLSEHTRSNAQSVDYAWTLDELALLDEFDGDTEALDTINYLISERGHSGRHAIEAVRAERQEAAAHAQALADLAAAGIPVAAEWPVGALLLTQLAARVEGFDPDQHGECPGRGAFFYSWRPERAELYCSTPEQHGYTAPEHIAFPSAAKPKDDGPPRKVVVEGNRAWMAAATVRQEWLAGFFARKSAPKPVTRFITRVLNDMPSPVRDRLGSAPRSELYRKLGGPADLEAALATATPGRLAILQLLPIAVAWEYQMSEVSAEVKNTWREGRHSPCPTADAAQWLRFVVNELGPELGDKAYVPAPIEQALIDGTPYQGSSTDAVSDSPATPESEEAGQEIHTDTVDDIEAAATVHDAGIAEAQPTETDTQDDASLGEDRPPADPSDVERNLTGVSAEVLDTTVPASAELTSDAQDEAETQDDLRAA